MKNYIDLLYVEDNEDYVNFVKRAVNKVDEKLVYHYINDSKKALEFFEKTNIANKNTRLILLDINLHGSSGIELLKKIRQFPHLKHVPVIMFSSSESSDDIKNAYDNGANAYLVKPAGLNHLTQTIKSVCDFWLSLNCSDIN